MRALCGVPGGRVCSGAYDGQLRVLSDKGATLCNAAAHEGGVSAVTALHTEAGEPCLLSGGKDCEAVVWRVDGAELQAVLRCVFTCV